MPRKITQYRVFIGSPGGLDEERKRFRETLEKCSLHHGAHKDVIFAPVGWEDTLNGVGRPQELINKDLEDCDYAVFVLHDRWGTPSGEGFTSGTQEEWALAEKLYQTGKIRNIALFFKQVDPAKLSDPGPQLSQVLAFKKSIETGKRYLFKAYNDVQTFIDVLDGHLAKWLSAHEQVFPDKLVGGHAEAQREQSPEFSPDVNYWLAEGELCLAKNPEDIGAALFCADKAKQAAKDDWGVARVKYLYGHAHFLQNHFDESLRFFDEIVSRFGQSTDEKLLAQVAKALFGKGLTLCALGRNEEEIAAYDDIVARLGASTEPALQEHVARALFSKCLVLDDLGRREEGISAYDDVVARYGASTEPALQEHVASSLLNKGVRLGDLGRNEEAIAAYDDVVARYGVSTEPTLQERVVGALLNKGLRFRALARNEEAIAACDDIISRYAASENKGLIALVKEAKSFKAEIKRKK